MKTKTSTINLIGGLALVFIAVVAYWGLARGSTAPSRTPPDVSPIAAEAPLGLIDLEARSQVAQQGEVKETQPAGNAEESTVELAAQLTESTTELRAVIEGSLYGQLDPGAFLDCALLLTELELSERVDPNPHPSGDLVYKLLGTPEGVTAQLMVRRVDNPAFGRPVLALMISLDPPTKPYLLEGAARRSIEAHVTLWRDPSGKVSNFGVLTRLAPTRVGGGPLDQGRIPMGLLYNFDADKPLEGYGSISELQDGQIRDRDTNVAIYGGQWPRLDDIEQLNGNLLKMYAKLQH